MSLKKKNNELLKKIIDTCNVSGYRAKCNKKRFEIWSPRNHHSVRLNILKAPASVNPKKTALSKLVTFLAS